MESDSVTTSEINYFFCVQCRTPIINNKPSNEAIAIVVISFCDTCKQFINPEHARYIPSLSNKCITAYLDEIIMYKFGKATKGLGLYNTIHILNKNGNVYYFPR